MKTEVYSWRVSTELKTGLETEARRRKLPVSAVLDQAARHWLEKSGAGTESEREQLRLRKTMLKCTGVFASGRVDRAESAGQIVRKRVRERHDR